jgi:hypothetical protein
MPVDSSPASIATACTTARSVLQTRRQRTGASKRNAGVEVMGRDVPSKGIRQFRRSRMPFVLLGRSVRRVKKEPAVRLQQPAAATLKTPRYSPGSGESRFRDEVILADFSNSTPSLSSATRQQIHNGFWRSRLPLVVSERHGGRQ